MDKSTRRATIIGLSLIVFAAQSVVPARAAAPADATQCGDVLFIGVAGSGQGNEDSGYGPKMFALSEQIAEQLPPDAHYDTEPLPYPAADIMVLAADMTLVPHGHKYSDSVLAGDTALAQRLSRLRAECPNELVILGGYSQGALVVHDLLDSLQDSDYWQRHIAGVSLIADPRRASADPVDRGTAGADTVGITFDGIPGINTPGLIPSVFAAKDITRSWCLNRDVVCAWTTGPFPWSDLPGEFLGRHSSYGVSALPDLFTNEAKRLVRQFIRFREWAPPTDPVSLGQVAAGYPAILDLAATFPFRQRFSAIGALPPGLTLSTSGLLRGTPTTNGTNTIAVNVQSRFGDVTPVAYVLTVADPGDVEIPVDPDPIAVTDLVLHQRVNEALPTIPTKSAVVLNHDSLPLPAGLTVTSAGRLVGTPKVVGDFTVVLRVAQTDRVRLVDLNLTIANPAALVSAAADGTPADSDVYDGIVLDPAHVAFVSDARNLGGPNDATAAVYIKNVSMGQLAYWATPANEFNPDILTGADKADLWIVTLAVDPDTGDTRSVIRRIHVAGIDLPGGAFQPTDYTSVQGADPHSGSYGVSSALGLLVTSDLPLDHPGQDSDGQRRLYRVTPSGATLVPAPPTEGVLSWSMNRIADVRADGAALVEATTLVNTDSGTVTQEGWFLLRANGRWQSIDLNSAGQRIPMSFPKFYAGGVVYAADPPAQTAALRPAAVIVNPKADYFKALGNSDPVLFGPSGAAAGIHPITPATWADGGGCATYNRNDPDRSHVSTAVTNGGATFTSCVADVNNATPFAASSGSDMLVSGVGDQNTRELLLGQVP
jgi:hypothetical protein